MFDRRQLAARAVVIVLMFAASGVAFADNAYEYRSEARDDLDLADYTDNTATNGAAHGKADADSDDENLIEEIVVIGKKKLRHPNPGSNSGIDPVMQMPDGIVLQFLPRYDPEQADRYFDLIQLDEETRRAGFIELFRFSFGR